MFKRFLISVSFLVLLTATSAMASTAPVINEFVANHAGTDTHEFVEVFDLPGVDLSNLTILEIEGDASGAGTIDGVFPVGTTDANGLWTTSFFGNVIENGTMTLLLVENFTGSQGDDIDTDNDGVMDSTPWTSVVDGVGIHDGGSSDHAYANVELTPFFDGSPFAPGGASRIPNGTDTDAVADWVRNDFDGEGLPGFSGTPGTGEALNTPGELNDVVQPPTDPIINEFVANHDGSDNFEFVEVLGDADTDYSNFRILMIEGDGANAGRVDRIRTPGVTNADGYWVTNFMSGVLENGSTTLLLVENSAAFIGLDLDTDNDGTLDVMPWGRLVDDVAVLNGGVDDQVYSSSVLTAGYDGNPALPGGASRIPDGTDTGSAADWWRNDFDGEGLPGFTGTPEANEALNTPGAMNEEAIDTTPPVITVDLNRTMLWPPNHKMVDIYATVVVTDNRDPSPTYVLVSITSSEPDNGKGDGNTVDDIQGDDPGTADTAFQLRAERMGGGDGREYTIVYEATDASGNTAQMTVAVRVPHDQSGMAMASAGFAETGETFIHGQDRFAVIIPSHDPLIVTDEAGNPTVIVDGFDATQIDVHHVYVGNYRGAIRPEERIVVDPDQDGRNDVALFFSIDDVRILQSAWTTTETGEDYIEFDKEQYGPISLHFEAPDGTEMKVANIFDLGAPVAITSDPYIGPIGDETPLLTSVYPNPFNPSTTVAFELKSSQRVVVRVFDVAGRLVRTLADDTFAPGSHDVRWNGYDNRGTPVASGIYFVRIDAGERSFTRRAVMLK